MNGLRPKEKEETLQGFLCKDAGDAVKYLDTVKLWVEKNMERDAKKKVLRKLKKIKELIG